MSGSTFAFKKFSIKQDHCAMKVGTDAVLLGAWVKTYGVRKILDIGTGTGVIALMLAQKSGARIDAIEIDAEAANEAAQNVSESPWPDRVRVIHTSLQDFNPNHDEKYDLIVSNPPYFIDSLPPSGSARTAARHAIHLPFEDLLNGVLRLLSREGKFCVILPVKEAEQFKMLAQPQGLFLNRLTRVKTTPEKTEKRWLMQFAYTAKPAVSDSTLILEKDKNVRHSYTEEYREMTKDYYIGF